ncbi:hypothetical protein RUMOBE_03216 [Blautia obeum ATCC 29174]|jgi:hypothetical protein|uniref:Uncharacterized protein n=1 Tax=Blautia obeum ATCC 29174 TaxID=411459 RepID=A5ZW23_9FIRM|nr:hypothetical protein RUMOBE_03216 [Blautia obeum ATCC 29174]
MYFCRHKTDGCTEDYMTIKRRRTKNKIDKKLCNMLKKSRNSCEK